MEMRYKRKKERERRKRWQWQHLVGISLSLKTFVGFSERKKNIILCVSCSHLLISSSFKHPLLALWNVLFLHQIRW